VSAELHRWEPIQVRHVTRTQDPQFSSTLSVEASSIALFERQRKVFGFSINVLIGTHPAIRGCRREKWRAKRKSHGVTCNPPEDSLTRLLQAQRLVPLRPRSLASLGAVGHQRNGEGDGAKGRVRVTDAGGRAVEGPAK